jgi:phage-related protein
MRKVNFYTTATGRRPIEGFLDSLTSKQTQKVAWVLNLVEELNIVPAQYFQKMPNTEDLWEVRVKFGSNIFRLLGFFDGAELLILAHAFQKKSQKTPKRAIRLAEDRKRDYFRRKKK